MQNLKKYPAADAAPTLRAMRNAFFLVAMLALPELAFATSDESFGGSTGKACSFLSNVRDLLNIASVAVVTVAIIFAGYQIAFAHKRISDVAPILIGGLLIGAAGQLAKWIMPDNAGDCAAGGGGTGDGGMAMLMDALHGIAQHAHGMGAYVA